MKQKLIIVLASMVMSLLLVEVMTRILCEQSTTVKRLCFYRHDPTAYAQIDSLEALVKSAPLPPRPYEHWNGFILNSKG